MKNILESASCTEGKLSAATLLKTDYKLVKILAFGAHYHLKPHQADTDVMILILEGTASATVQGKTEALNPMDHFIFPKGEIHELTATSDMKMLLIK